MGTERRRKRRSAGRPPPKEVNDLDTKIKAVSLKKRLVTLFFSMLSISAFTFGGGFVIVTLMKRRFVDDLEWLDENEMLDMTAIAQSCPGAIAVNGAILVGQRVAGAAGIIVATVATIIPPMVILSLVSYFYALFADNPYVAAVLAGMQAGVAAVIVDVVLNLGTGVVKTKRWLLDVIMVAAFAAAISGVNVIYIILTSGVIGVICAKGEESPCCLICFSASCRSACFQSAAATRPCR